MVDKWSRAANWRDYALRIDLDVAIFAAFRRHSERPGNPDREAPRFALKAGRVRTHWRTGRGTEARARACTRARSS